MARPSQPVGGTDAEGEGHKNSEAEGEIEDVKHCRSPEKHSRETARRPRKGAMRVAAHGRKDRIKNRIWSSSASAKKGVRIDVSAACPQPYSFERGLQRRITAGLDRKLPWVRTDKSGGGGSSPCWVA